MTSAADNRISIDVDQNEYLAEGARTAEAIITIEITDQLAIAEPPKERVEIIIIDCSGSMGAGDKFANARRATLAALDVVADGTRFVVVEGTDKAEVVYPKDAPSAVASQQTRSAARHALDKLRPHGGTAMGTWLALARLVAQHHPDAMVHAILLTDGRNEHETTAELEAEIKASEGVFTCDCRGVGGDWMREDLDPIAFTLHGTLDIVKQPHELAADFASMMEVAMEKAIPELTLRVWTPVGARIVFVKQVAPSIEDFTSRRTTGASEQIGEYPLGAWGTEERDYHITLDIEPAAPGREKLAARVWVVADGEPLGEGKVKAVWTTDTELSARISRRVAHYTGQAELADVIRQGLDARKAGDLVTATAKLQRAVRLAAESGNDNTAKLLRAVVDVDERTGTARLRAEIDKTDALALDVRSRKTARVRKEGS
ncbi:VWA domain-containing protein [Nocardia sp. NPDC051030]|uniref:VWA domain-containing protein n=1 Tax=Nocardia sp. NPDC051030 TaxID=3155162 RepID=UPI00342476A2